MPPYTHAYTSQQRPPRRVGPQSTPFCLRVVMCGYLWSEGPLARRFKLVFKLRAVRTQGIDRCARR